MCACSGRVVYSCLATKSGGRNRLRKRVGRGTPIAPVQAWSLPSFRARAEPTAIPIGTMLGGMRRRGRGDGKRADPKSPPFFLETRHAGSRKVEGAPRARNLDPGAG